MKFLPRAQCPSCTGPITFMDVLSIVTPFQSVDCSTCGELVFLKHRVELFIFSLVFALAVFVGVVFILVNGVMPIILTNMVGLGIIVAVELLITTYIIKKNDLTVRRNK